MELMLATTPVNYFERLPLCLLQRHELRGSRASHKTRQWSRCKASGAAAQQAKSEYRQRDARDVRVVVFGATGYIGKFVVKELVKRGYNVVAFAREKSGIGGKQSTQDVQKVRQPFPRRPAADSLVECMLAWCHRSDMVVVAGVCQFWKHNRLGWPGQASLRCIDFCSWPQVYDFIGCLPVAAHSTG